MFTLLTSNIQIARYCRTNIAEFANIAEKNLRNFTIFSLILASGNIAECANIAEISWVVEVFITILFECVKNAVIFSN
jgi:hypothetical protein